MTKLASSGTGLAPRRNWNMAATLTRNRLVAATPIQTAVRRLGRHVVVCSRTLADAA
jgi:hypothetical protein